MLCWTTTELKLGAVFGAVWGFLDFILGGIDSPVIALACLIIVDFLTGVTAAYVNSELNSRIGASGIMRKVGIFVCIMIAFFLDTATGMHMFRGMVIAGFAIIEAISIVENIDKLGFGYIIPQFIRIHLAKIAAEKKIIERSNEND